MLATLPGGAAAAVRCMKIELMKFYLYPGINLANQAMLPKPADSVGPLAASSTTQVTTSTVHFTSSLHLTICLECNS